MTEVVEVEIQKEGLKAIVGDTVTSVKFYDKGDVIVRPTSAEYFVDCILKKRVERVIRVGKKIGIDLGDFWLVSHLAMTGRWLLDVPEEKVGHTRIEFQLESGRVLRYSDVRVFGRIQIKYMLDDVLKATGIDVFTATKDDVSIVIENAQKLARYNTTAVKKFLLNQHCITGLGNVYANEILFDANINPARQLLTLSEDEIYKLSVVTRKKLDEAYKLGGLSMKDYYHVNGEQGEMQNHLAVYRKEHCKHCKSKIVKDKTIDGRATYYCPCCQH